MKRNRKIERLGFGYIANHSTREIHKASGVEMNCNIARMKNGGYCTFLWSLFLLCFCGYDGCFWCNRKWNKK